MRREFFYKNGNARDGDSPASLDDLMRQPATTPEQHRSIMNGRVERRRAIEDALACRSLSEAELF